MKNRLAKKKKKKKGKKPSWSNSKPMPLSNMNWSRIVQTLLCCIP